MIRWDNWRCGNNDIGYAKYRPIRVKVSCGGRFLSIVHVVGDKFVLCNTSNHRYAPEEFLGEFSTEEEATLAAELMRG